MTTPVQLPARYIAAKQALAEARRFDEVKDLRDQALAIEVYAFQAKDGELAADAIEIRKRAERRIGELMAERREAGRLARGGGDKRSDHRVRQRPGDVPSLEEQGVDKHLADRARKAAAMPTEQFEVDIAKSRALAVALAEDEKAVIREARAEQQSKKRERRAQRERDLAAKITALPDQKFGVILEDFEWDFETFSRLTGMDRHASNHYPTAAEAHTPEEIVERTKDRMSVAADDSALFMWVLNPFLAIGIKVLELRGFKYITNWAWTKDGLGTGYWNRETHELLLLGMKGKLPAPAMGDQWPSSKHTERRAHSQKPDWQYELIEAYFPTLPKIELNARSGRAGWVSWGNEAPTAEVTA
jgi:N6-adenosine-specific RNA methylase IME4